MTVNYRRYLSKKRKKVKSANEYVQRRIQNYFIKSF